jgi:hypothetical protein
MRMEHEDKSGVTVREMATAIKERVEEIARRIRRGEEPGAPVFAIEVARRLVEIWNAGEHDAAVRVVWKLTASGERHFGVMIRRHDWSIERVETKDVTFPKDGDREARGGGLMMALVYRTGEAPMEDDIVSGLGTSGPALVTYVEHWSGLIHFLRRGARDSVSRPASELALLRRDGVQWEPEATKP